MKDFIKHILYLLLITLGVATLFSESSLYFLRQGSFYKPSFVSNSLSHTNYDYIVIGSSIGLTTLNTVALDSITELQGVNLSMDDTGIGAHYLMLKHFLAEGKTTRYCVLSTSAASLSTLHPTMSTNDYRFLPYIRRDYVSSYFDTQKAWEPKLISLSRYFSVAGVSYYNAELFYPSLLSIYKPSLHNRFDSSGNFHYPMDTSKNHQSFSSEAMPIKLQNPYLKALKSLCEKNAIQLVVYIPPIKGKKVVVDTTDYFIVNHSSVFSDSYYFNDLIHVNFEGRTLASSLFADALKTLVND